MSRLVKGGSVGELLSILKAFFTDIVFAEEKETSTRIEDENVLIVSYLNASLIYVAVRKIMYIFGENLRIG